MCCRVPLHMMPLAREGWCETESRAGTRTDGHAPSESVRDMPGAMDAVLVRGLKALFVAAAIALGLATPVLLGVAAQAEQAQSPAEAGGFTTIDTRALATMLEDKTFLFVNVHIPYEGEIDGTDANIPFDTITEHLGELPADKAAAIVLYCRSGRMSEIAAGTLSGLGYTNVTHVAGGMVDWQRDGNDIVFK